MRHEHWGHFFGWTCSNWKYFLLLTKNCQIILIYWERCWEQLHRLLPASDVQNNSIDCCQLVDDLTAKIFCNVNLLAVFCQDPSGLFLGEVRFEFFFKPLVFNISLCSRCLNFSNTWSSKNRCTVFRFHAGKKYLNHDLLY